MILAAVCLSWLPALLPNDLPTEPVIHGDLGQRAHEYLTRLERLGFGGSVLIAQGDEILLSHGYGLARKSEGVPFGPETVVSCGSISKQFTGAAVAKLAMDEWLDLDDTIDLYFDDVPDDKMDITIRQLLHHTSGLGAHSAEANDRESYVRAVLETDLHFSPGERFHYSNLGYNLLAALVEVVADAPFEDFLLDELFTPVGMTKTGVDRPQWDRDTIASGYRGDTDLGSMLERPRGQRVAYGLAGSGGIHSTTLDMFRWHRALLGEELFDGPMKEQMFTPGPGTTRGPNAGYGFGWGVRETPWGTRMISHNGSNDIFSADCRRFLEDDVFLYATGNDANFYCFDITPQLVGLLFDQPHQEPPEATTMSGEELERFAGTYRLPMGGGDRGVGVPSGNRGTATAIRGCSRRRPVVSHSAERDRGTPAITVAHRAADVRGRRARGLHDLPSGDPARDAVLRRGASTAIPVAEHGPVPRPVPRRVGHSRSVSLRRDRHHRRARLRAGQADDRVLVLPS